MRCWAVLERFVHIYYSLHLIDRLENATSCEMCPANTYSNKPGSGECRPCGHGVLSSSRKPNFLMIYCRNKHT